MGAIMEFFKKLAVCAENIFSMIFYKKPNKPFPPRPKPSPKPNPDGRKTIKYYLNDPAYPNLISEISLPQPNGLQLVVPNLQVGNFEFTSPQGLANNAYALLCHGINLFNEKFHLSRWATVQKLNVNTMAGMDANAYYDRSSLKFFFFNNKNGQTVYTALSSDIVSHELGHALLDAIRPDLFSTAAMEVWAFHESFGDINAIICALYHEELVNYVLNETNGDLRKSNIVSQVAEQFGVSLGRSNCLREAANNLKYVNPASLPTKSNDPNALVREPHNFSRIMTGTFYEVLCSIYEKNGRNRDALVRTRDYLCNSFYKACSMAPATANFFEAFGQAWIKQDEQLGGLYKDIISSVFSSRSIFQVRMMEAEDPQASDKKVVETVRNDNMKLELCCLSVPVKELLGDAILGMTEDNSYADMKVQLAVDNLKIKMVGDEGDDITWMNCCDGVAQAKTAAKNLVQYILDNKLIGNTDDDIWYKDEDNNLKRRLFQCDCFRPNYLFPGNPEYNKPYKPENNTGCCTYGSCANNKPKPTVVTKTSCNIRYGSSCRSISYNGKCR